MEAIKKLLIDKDLSESTLIIFEKGLIFEFNSREKLLFAI